MKAIALMAALCAAPAAAQDTCKYRGDLQEIIEHRWGEVTVGYGLRLDDAEDGDTVIEIWVGRSGSWTITETHDSGRACIVAFGDSWVFIEQPWPEIGELN